MDLEHSYNFNDPLEVTEVFRSRVSSVNKEGDVIRDDFEEYAISTAVVWEDIKLINQYPYPDDWVKCKGEKYHLYLHGQEPKLILGSYRSMLQYWTMFRNRFPLFPNQSEE